MAQARLDVKVTGDSSGALRAINAVRAAAPQSFEEAGRKRVHLSGYETQRGCRGEAL